MQSIIVNNLTKKFKINDGGSSGFLLSLVNFVYRKPNPNKNLLVINDISFSVGKGDVIGIVGKNGSGKSTLLRVLAGIYKNYQGDVKISGRVVPLVNLGLGLNYRLNMADNIYLVGSLFGLNRREIRQKFSSIVEFSGLEEFVYTKLHKFSTGMIQRLVFSIAVSCTPEVLLLDEIFEVGDEDFRNRSGEKIKELIINGATVFLVSHDMDIIQKNCNRAIWLENGKILKDGQPEEVIRAYLSA